LQSVVEALLGQYLRALPDGRREIDYGVVALRF